mgnify:CR=1 FL=1
MAWFHAPNRRNDLCAPIDIDKVSGEYEQTCAHLRIEPTHDAPPANASIRPRPEASCQFNPLRGTDERRRPLPGGNSNADDHPRHYRTSLNSCRSNNSRDYSCHLAQQHHCQPTVIAAAPLTSKFRTICRFFQGLVIGRIGRCHSLIVSAQTVECRRISTVASECRSDPLWHSQQRKASA